MQIVWVILLSFLPTALYSWMISEALNIGFWSSVLLLYLFLLLHWLVRSAISWITFFAFTKGATSDDYLAGLREGDYPIPREGLSLAEHYFEELRDDESAPVPLRIEAAADKARFDAYRAEARGQDLLRLSIMLKDALMRFRAERVG